MIKFSDLSDALKCFGSWPRRIGRRKEIRMTSSNHAFPFRFAGREARASICS